MTATDAISFRVLGPLEVRAGDVPLIMPGLRQRALLARLLVAGGRVVPVHRIIGDLWEGEPPAQAIATVQTFVSRLRRAIEPGRAPRSAASRLVTVPPGYALRAAAHEVDAWHFADLVRSAVASEGDPPAELARLDEALALWRGPAYPEFAGERWANAEAERLAELHRVAVERRADALLRLGRARELIADLEAQVVQFPLREEGWRLLALARYACGRQGDALAALREARATLRDQLGVDPGPALRELEADILAQAAHLTLARPMPPARPAPPVPPAEPDLFVGHDDELERILQAARKTTGLAVVLISGATGAGKSRLAGEAADRLREQGWTAARGRCAETDGMPPGWAWTDVVRALAAVRPPALETATQLGWLLSDDLPADRPLDGRHRTHRALGDYLRSCAPLALIVDDVHRLDEETLALLAGALRALRDVRAVLLLTLRDNEPSPLLDELLGLIAAYQPERIELRGLPAWAVGRIVAALSTSAVDDPTVAAIAERTGGNPFFVRETARLLESDGPEAALSAVPAGVRDVVRRRMSPLPAAARTVLVAAAVLDHHSEPALLAAVSGADDETVLDAVEAGLMVGLLVESGPARVAFPHALVREALYESVSGLRRGRLHARAAAALQRSAPHDVAALAHHFAAAGDAAAAGKYAALAAEDAERRYAYRDAARLWQQALAACDLVGGPPGERLRLLLGRVHALSQAGEQVTARALRAETLREASAVDDPLLTARVLASFDVPSVWTSRPYATVDSAVVALTTRTLDRLPAGDGEPRARLLINLALELEGEDDPRGRAAVAEAEAMARRLGDPALLAMALNAVFLHSYCILDLDRRVRAGTDLVRLGSTHRMPAAEIVGRMALAGAHTTRGDLTAATAEVDVVAELAETYDQPLNRSIAGFHRALCLTIAGRLADAEEAYAAGSRVLDPLGRWGEEPELLIYARATLALAAGHPGDLPGICLGPGPGLRSQAELQAVALVLAGRPDEAAAAVNARPIRRDYTYDLRWAARGLYALIVGDRPGAEAAYATLLPLEDFVCGGVTANLTLGPIAHILGDLAAALGRPSAGHYAKAAELAERAGAPLWHERAVARRPLLVPAGSLRFAF